MSPASGLLNTLIALRRKLEGFLDQALGLMLEMMAPDEHAPSDDPGADIVQSAGSAPATEPAIPR